MTENYKYEKRYKYPHLKPNDIAIWERFIDSNPTAFDTVQYDFNVGDPPPFNPLMQDGEDLNQDALYRFKIDVIGHKKDSITLIELKKDAGASSIGQIKSYKTLYIRDEQPKKPINMWIITNIIRQNMVYLCKQENVKLIEI
jgi:hypothetical protein